MEYITKDLALVGNGELLVSTGAPLNLGELRRAPVSPKPKTEPSGEVATWGEDNDFPQRIIEIAEKSTEIPSLLDWQARVLQGREVVAMERYFDEESNSWKFRSINDDEIDTFLSDSTFKRYMYEASTDFYWFANVFPELIKSKGGDKIAYLGTQDASFCRYGKMNTKGVIEKCYVSADWPDAKVADETTNKLTVIDPYDFERIDKVRRSSDDRFIYPISYPSPGKIYYQLSKWNGYITSGWAEIARSIPEGKRHMMKRILSAKYILQIPMSYWITAYKDWAKLTQEEQTNIKKQKVKEINDQLTGLENSGKTILTEVGFDAQTGKEIFGWKVEVVPSAVKEGENLEDSREASEHLMRAIGTDPTLVGDGPGKKMGSGSGSDKRVAFNIYVATLQPHRNLLLEPLDFIAEYNGWKKKYPRLVFKFVEVQLDTLDTGSTAKTVTN